MFSPSTRPDLGNRLLLVLLGVTALGCLLAGWLMHATRPGEPAAQLAAIAGTILLLVPVGFSLLKRADFQSNSPLWFVAHVLAACVASILIVAHAAGGTWSSPAVLVLLALLFLVVQGIIARTLVARQLSQVFAASGASFNFGQPIAVDRDALAGVIKAKQHALKSLDPDANEATFSPVLRHWLSHPQLTWQYQQLVSRESRIVGARERAGPLLRWWRIVHLVVAALFVAGLVAHLVVMLLFAGYAAGDGPVYWWHLAAWGKR